MTNERAGLFEEENEDFDVSGFAPKQPDPKNQPPPPAEDAIRAVSESSQFRSREPIKPGRREAMRYRTGRNLQFNVKLRADTVELFYETAKSQGWTLGETVERALTALRTRLGS